MERLTFEGNFCDIAQCRDSACKQDGTCTQKEVWERLKAYEDAGLTPAEVLSMHSEWSAMMSVLNSIGSYGRLRELAEADSDGRVVVLPCKVGGTVWRIKRAFAEYPDKSKPYIEPDAFLLQDVFNIGKTVFSTREEAEKALQEMGGKKDG
nr:MAG TPA: hypothetical protein [Caudoviricetes sp.]